MTDNYSRRVTEAQNRVKSYEDQMRKLEQNDSLEMKEYEEFITEEIN